MKALYYSSKHIKTDFGGNVIRKRNLLFLKEFAGEKNVDFYPRMTFDGIKKIFLILQELSGIELGIDTGLLQKLKGVDAVFIDGTNEGSFTKFTLRRTKTICFFHNVEYDYICQESAKFKGLKNELKYMLLKPATFNYEKRLCKYSSLIITLNNRDSDRLEKLYGRKSDLVIPTSMNDVYIDKERSVLDPYLLFVGSDFYGNTDGLFWFCNSCMPFINGQLIVVGNGMEKYKDRYPSNKISFNGYVDDLSELYRNAAAVVLPIISGSGMKTKTCEALMYGKMIFGTAESFEGYLRTKDCILCETDEEFVKKINTYLNGEVCYFSQDNRDLFLQNYENSVVMKSFINFFAGEKE